MDPINPPDVIAAGAPTNIKLCADCIDAYRDGIEPGESACEEYVRTTAPAQTHATRVAVGLLDAEGLNAAYELVRDFDRRSVKPGPFVRAELIVKAYLDGMET